MSNVADDAFGRWLEARIEAWREIGVEAERNRIIKLIEAERDAWTRQPAFNYKNALTDLIEKIK